MQGAIPNQSHNLSREVGHTTGVYVPYSFRAVAFSQNKIVMGKKIPEKYTVKDHISSIKLEKAIIITSKHSASIFFPITILF